jgi:hypothetical protein
MDLGRDHHRLAIDAEMLERPAEHLLAGPVRIDVGGVEEIDAGVERRLDERPRLVLLQRPLASGFRAVSHHAEAEPRDLETGLAEIDEIHGGCPKDRRRDGGTIDRAEPAISRRDKVPD